MGFDFGTQKMGVAIGQTLSQTTSPLQAIKAKDGIPNWDNLTLLIDEWQPDCFIVGCPLNMDGSESEMSRRARKFANRLQGRFNRPSHMVDERLSSFEARQEIKLRQEEKGWKKLSLDSVAATLIIETWYRESNE